MVVVAQLVRASVCGTEGRGFEPHLPPRNKVSHFEGLFLFTIGRFGSILYIFVVRAIKIYTRVLLEQCPIEMNRFLTLI